MQDIKEKIVPQQHEGGKKDITHTVVAIDEDAARKLFVIARNRLYDVNRWHELCGPASATFSITDGNGDQVNRTAEKGDYFQIDLPAPGPTEGKGHDWVYIEAIEDQSDSTGPYESAAIRVRPTQNPKEKGDNVAHFFENEATSTFVVERKGLEVTAAVFGRNEKPNTSTDNIIDKVRNAIVGVTAIFGLSNAQWNSLVKGLIEQES
ncbi:hypothetical protein [Chryseosolibacter indicus]|uniref:Uncharacterized protein n=1 Tax=Chryseosolibacter indicus TaxID=2782351 RepID=A0ABS5VUL1_9BACT|nr:hypothetical protein [Chryseosolibacter indicus]MBT1705114.1 hypothetical protein [Chryseosolibacter indicus]